MDQEAASPKTESSLEGPSSCQSTLPHDEQLSSGGSKTCQSTPASIIQSLPPEEAGKINDTAGNREPKPNERMTRAKIPHSCGVYIRGSLHGVPTVYTIDTGASRTIISSKLFKSIPLNDRPMLDAANKVTLEQAGGKPLHQEGVAVMKLDFGVHILEKEVIIADITDDVLLGMDVGEIDIITSQNEVVINGVTIPCTYVPPSRIYRVYAVDDYEIPGFTESIVQVELSQSGQGPRLGETVLQPSIEFLRTYPLLMARALVDFQATVSGYVRVLNLNEETVTLKKNAAIATAEE